ncbi:hypothetical protein EW146_g2314 [Bondarzewia mesenterica]|uniref:Protein UNC80 C-terminal domain-containing protein n=1 Tax=Bondarzewia mesenterica TaxID=1095465 RepID=A0A4S4M104_9AGAM|nr:hypothetical protein EW146_g2314 [Bondarzewia mesenterica]
MAPRDEQKKKSSGGRHFPKRLFSFDSISEIGSSEKSSLDNSKSGSNDISYNSRVRAPTPSAKLDFSFIEKPRAIDEDYTDPFSDSPPTAVSRAGSEVWTGVPLTDSPTSTSGEDRTLSPKPASSTLPSATNRSSSISSGRRRPVKKPSLLSALTESSAEIKEEPPSPSKRRWDHLRQHVLPSSSRPLSRSSTPAAPSPAFAAPSRPGTPKQFRIGRLGFKQVVEHAQEASEDHAERFAKDVLDACWLARFGEQKGHKPDREISPGTFNLTFMSSNSVLGLSSANSSTTGVSTNMLNKRGMRRPPSMQSMNSSSRATPSITALSSVLSRYASISSTWQNTTNHLPHETQVLSTLLIPFLKPISGTQVEAERMISIEAFEVAAKTWVASSSAADLDRCLWCCKAALADSLSKPIRMRLLGIFSSFLFTPRRPFKVDSPIVLQTLLQQMFSLLVSLSQQTDAHEEVQYLRELIAGVLVGSAGDLDEALVETEYNVTFTRENAQSIRDCAAVLALSACLENDIESNRRWALRYLIDEYWPAKVPISHPHSLTSLYVRKLSHFTHSLLSFFRPFDATIKPVQNVDIIIRLLQTCIIPEADSIDQADIGEARALIVVVVLNIFCLDGTREQDESKTLIQNWYAQGGHWKYAFEKGLQHIVETDSWPSVLAVLTALVEEFPDDLRTPMTAFFIPLLNDRLTKDPPSYPSSQVTELLDTISQMYPKLFYKPLFACAAATKDATIINQLRIIAVLTRFLPNFWIRDVEMLLVALMSDSKPAKQASQGREGPVWGKIRIGQLVILTELIAYVQAISRGRDSSPVRTIETICMHMQYSSVPYHIQDQAFAAQTGFFFALDHQIGVLIEAKERTILVPEAQRIVLCVLLFEIRLLLRSLKPARWLLRVVSWVVDDKQIFSGPEDEDTSAIISKLASLYAGAQEKGRVAPKVHRASIFALSASVAAEGPSPVTSITNKNAGFFARLSDRARMFESYSKGLLRNALRLLVAVSGLLNLDNHLRLSPVLWRDCLDSHETEIQASATFLIMQGAEKSSSSLLQLIRDDMYSPESLVRLQATRRFSTLSSWRFQLLSQKYITDKHHRRPFKLARGPISFVATDIGSSLFILEDDADEIKDSNGVVLPLELRRRLLEIGWGDDTKPVDQQTRWIKTPMSLLPSLQLERLEGGGASTPRSPSPLDWTPSSPSESAEIELGRANSSYNSVKRRAIFVPPLASVLPDLANLVFDSDYAVATAARNTIVDFMREDPTLLSRPILDSLSEGGDNIASAISTLRALLHIQRQLPPAMAHYLFNHITGFLKYTAKLEASTALREFAYSVPVLSKLVNQVSDMSLKEIRRAKLEMFLIPSGALWFPPSAPPGPMFPRGLLDSRTQVEPGVPLHLAQITMIRIAQNMFLLSMLKRNPGDVQAVRKSMSLLILPLSDDAVDSVPPDLNNLVPRKEKARHTSNNANAKLAPLSLILARSYILLVAQIFRSMPRHLNDRGEFAVLADGLNRCLLAHGDDIGVVSQVLIAFMVASTRFRRMFTSGGGYTIFMPAVLKVYAESELNQGIRAAIEYAASRFYALHQEAFIFQSLDVESHVAVLPGVDGPWMANHIYSLLSTLKDNASQFAPDSAGIHDLNKVQEREALLNSHQVDVALPEQYEGGHLALDDLVRLFLTVIGHNPTIRRAQNFLRLLRYMVPKLYDASPSSRKVLYEGVDALSIIFLTRSAGRTKIPEAAQIRPSNDFSYEVWSQKLSLSNDLHGKSKEPSDLAEMRLDYLSLVVAFTGSGGHLGSSTHHRVIELVKHMLKDGNSDRAAAFLLEYTRTSLVRKESLRVKHVLAFLTELAPVFKAYASTTDFSGVLSAITSLAAMPFYAKEPSFSRLVVSQYCVAGLEACELAASENLLFSLPLRPALIKLLSQAIFLSGVDIIEELKKRALSYEYMAGIIFPLVLVLPSTPDTIRKNFWTDASSRDAPRRAWVRLLSLVMQACRRTVTLRESNRSSVPLERTKSQETHNTSSRAASAMTISVSLQILKIIVIRAGNDLSHSVPGIWIQIGTFLKSLLSDGDAAFALSSQDVSEPPSPLHLPKGLHPTGLDDINPSTPLGSRNASPTKSPFSQPRIIDYLLWSTLEFLSLYRCPLLLQLRILMQEKVAVLGQDLQNQYRPISSRLSFSSVFSKPRRGSGHWSTGPSPENSPMLTALPSFPAGDLLSLPSTPQRPAERQPGYARSPVSPGGHEFAGPKIVHLGPVHNTDPFRRSISPSGGRMRLTMTKSTTIKSVSLVRATYRRIRVVQHLMCYPTLLPGLDGDADNDADEVSNLKSWTASRALREVTQETNELMEEFREAFGGDEDEGILGEAEQLFTG